MAKVTIDSKMMLGSRLPEFPRRVVKNEPMLFNCDFDAAWRLGGPITRYFIDAVLRAGGFGSPAEAPRYFDAPIIVDTRVHMLMPGWYPCIPGWHHDDVPRTRADGQPDYVTPVYKARHAMAMV